MSTVFVFEYDDEYPSEELMYVVSKCGGDLCEQGFPAKQLHVAIKDIADKILEVLNC